MRTFDYRHLPKSLFDGKVGDANVQLYEDRGKFELIKQMHPEVLEAMREKAHFENVDASAHIDGIYVDAARVRAVLAGQPPADETESQIIGYSNALKLVEGGFGAASGASEHAPAALSTASIVRLYECLYAHRNLGRKSRYRKKDYVYVQVDGHMQAMPVSPIKAFETPLVLGGACDSLAAAFSAEACSPLIMGAVFTVDFLCIRPFDEGNGRIARLFAELLLACAGFDVFRYVSVDRIIEGRAMGYYDALNACVEKWDRGLNDYSPYARFWLQVVHEAYEQLFESIERMSSSSAGGKTERVRRFVRDAGTEVSKRQVREALPDVSEATIEAALGKMVKEGAVSKCGRGRATSYVWNG